MGCLALALALVLALTRPLTLTLTLALTRPLARALGRALESITVVVIRRTLVLISGGCRIPRRHMVVIEEIEKVATLGQSFGRGADGGGRLERDGLGGVDDICHE